MVVGGDAERVAARVGGDGELDSMAGAGIRIAAEVGDEIVRGVVFRIFGSKILVHLIDGLDTGRATQGSDRLRHRALEDAVVHDRHARGEAVDQDGVVAAIESVVVDLVDIDLADAVYGCHQFTLLVPGKITAVEEAESDRKSVV